MKRRRAKARKRRKKRRARQPSLVKILLRIRKKVGHALIVKDKTDLQKFYLSLVKAAFAKCLDYNEAINADDVRRSDGFFYAAALRGICEDLIVLRFLAKLQESARQDYLVALVSKNLAEGIGAQHRFFKVNNPLQPLFGTPFPIGAEKTEKVEEFEIDIAQNIEQRRFEFNHVARSLGLPNPTILEMAKAVGLVATYDFIYFLASNFVHFNPSSC